MHLPNQQNPKLAEPERETGEYESYAEFSARLEALAESEKSKSESIPPMSESEEQESFEEFSARLNAAVEPESGTGSSPEIEKAIEDDDSEVLNLYDPEDSKPMENPDLESAFPLYSTQESDPFTTKEDLDEEDIEVEFPNFPQDEETFIDPNQEQTQQITVGEISEDNGEDEELFSSLRGSFIDDDAIEEETQYAQKPYIKPLPDSENPFTVDIETLSDDDLLQEEETPRPADRFPERENEISFRDHAPATPVFERDERGFPERESPEQEDPIRQAFNSQIDPFENT